MNYVIVRILYFYLILSWWKTCW